MASETQEASSGWVKRVIIGRDPRRTLARLIVWVVLLVVISKFVLLPIRVQGISMLPTYKEGRVNFVNRLAYLFHEPRRGDVVAIKLAGQHVMLLKRIIGLPGETLAFQGGRVFINGQPLEERYLKGSCNWQEPADKIGTIGPDEYYVVGDNRSMDFREHYQGRASRSRIVGKVLL